MFPNDETYIGDGVYLSFDGWNLWLRTHSNNRVALEPAVFEALLTQAKKLPHLQRSIKEAAK